MEYREESLGAAENAALAGLGLAGLGLVFAASAAAMEVGFARALALHGMKLGLALVVLLCLVRIDFSWLRRSSGPLFSLLCGLTAMAAFFGVEKGGASRWLELPGTGLCCQPTEPAKIALILFTAHLAGREEGRIRLSATFWPAALLMLVLFIQPDIGSALLCGIVAIAVLVVAGLSLRRLVPVFLAGAAFLLLAWLFLPHVARRLPGFWDPPQGSQVGLALTALGNGGHLGTGIGRGMMKLGHLPKAGNDFVFALVGEELGLVGTLGVLALIGLFGWYGFKVAARCQDRFMGLTVFGLVFCILVQALIHVAVNTAMVPPKGIDFPFLGAGGSSLVFALGSVGVVIAAARQGVGKKEQGQSRTTLIGGNGMANVERYGVLSLCFLVIIVLGITLFPGGKSQAGAGGADLPALEQSGQQGLRRTDPQLFPRNIRGSREHRPGPAREERVREYTVKRGDTLGQISQAHYGTTRMLPAILQANPRLGDGHFLKPGWKVKLPPRSR